MADKISVLVDTDIFIDYFNHRIFRDFFESGRFTVYYSAVTKKELLTKPGLTDAEQQAIRKLLKHCRLVSLTPGILDKYSKFRKAHPPSGKEDCLIAATAVNKKFPLATRNYRHFRPFPGLVLYFSKT